MSLDRARSRAETIRDAAGVTVPFEGIDVPALTGDFVTPAGRTYEVEGGAHDRVTIRGRSGEVVLAIEFGDRGPVLRFASAEVEVSAHGRLCLAASRVEITASESLDLQCAGAIRTQAGGDCHTRASGAVRTEASEVELQASVGAVRILAAGAVRVDGEHIGLNDDPEPRPFSWSAVAFGSRKDDSEGGG